MSKRNVDYMPTEKNEVLIYAFTWGNLENVRLRKSSQSQKAMYYMIHYYEPSSQTKPHRGKDSWGCRGRWGSKGVGPRLLSELMSVS